LARVPVAGEVLGVTRQVADSVLRTRNPGTGILDSPQSSLAAFRDFEVAGARTEWSRLRCREVARSLNFLRIEPVAQSCWWRSAEFSGSVPKVELANAALEANGAGRNSAPRLVRFAEVRQF